MHVMNGALNIFFYDDRQTLSFDQNFIIIFSTHILNSEAAALKRFSLLFCRFTLIKPIDITKFSIEFFAWCTNTVQILHSINRIDFV